MKVSKEEYIKELKKQYREERLSRYSKGDFTILLWNDFLEDIAYNYFLMVKARLDEDTSDSSI